MILNNNLMLLASVCTILDINMAAILTQFIFRSFGGSVRSVCECNEQTT